MLRCVLLTLLKGLLAALLMSNFWAMKVGCETLSPAK
jgi:hypothetical protein